MAPGEHYHVAGPHNTHPYLIFNVDETSLSMKPVAARVMLLFMRKFKQSLSANSSPKRQYYFNADKEKSPHVTLECCICSSGHKQRPFFIIPEGKTVLR